MILHPDIKDALCRKYGDLSDVPDELLKRIRKLNEEIRNLSYGTVAGLRSLEVLACLILAHEDDER